MFFLFFLFFFCIFLYFFVVVVVCVVVLERNRHMKERTTELKGLDFEIMNTCIAISVEVWDLDDVISFNASWNSEPNIDGLFDVFKLDGECLVLLGLGLGRGLGV